MKSTARLVLFTIGLFLVGAPMGAFGQGNESSRTVGLLSIQDVSGDVLQAARMSVSGPDEVGKDGPMAQIGMELALLYHQHRLAGSAGVRSLREQSTPEAKVGDDERRGQMRVHSPISADGRTVVVDAVAAAEVSSLMSDLQRLGLEGGAAAGNVVSGRLPISALGEAAQLASLRGMLPSYARLHAGSVGSEADTAHFVYQAREEQGVDGSGQKICALSDSYDTANAQTSASDDVQSGDLPGNGNPDGHTTPVDVLAEYDGDDPRPTDEGRAMLQVAHDLAPGATLGFHTAFGGLATFASGIENLANTGCTVIVDDVRYSTEPFYQDGPVSNAVEEVVSNDVAYFSSAGNNGQDSYEAPFRNSGEPGVISSTAERHDFDSSTLNTDTEQEITIDPGGTFQVFALQWTDPSAQVEESAGADTDIDMALIDENGDVVAESTNDNITLGVPSETMEYSHEGSSPETYQLVIEKAAGPDPDQIKYVYSGFDFTIEEHDTLGPTLFGHPMAEGAMAVAAAPFYNTAEYNSSLESGAALESISSKGGIQILFDGNGDRLDTPEDRQKPEVTGTDGVNNTFFGTSEIPEDIDPNPAPNFFGTSAAAPHIAAIGALIRQARPDFSPTEVYDRLESNSEDVTTRQNRQGDFEDIGAGVDPWSGHGFVRADQAVPEPSGIQIAGLRPEEVTVTPSDRGSVMLSWQQIGSEAVDELVVERKFFDGPFREELRFPTEGPGEYSRTIEDLAAGDYLFRVTAIARIDEDGDGEAEQDSLLARDQTFVTVRKEGVDVTVYPNPFEDDLNVSVTLPEASTEDHVLSIAVFDALGRRVAVPTRSWQIRDSGSISLDSGAIQSMGSGVYFFRVRGVQDGGDDRFVETTKAIHVR